MSTKLRIAIEVEGMRFFGNGAKALLRDSIRTTHRMPERLYLRPMKERIEWAFERMPYTNKKLYLFQEPARVKEKDSKYKQLLKSWGMRDHTRANARIAQRTRDITARLQGAAPRGRARAATPAPATTPANRRITPPGLGEWAWQFANGNQIQMTGGAAAWATPQDIDFYGGFQ